MPAGQAWDDLRTRGRVHFVGIGGAGMNALAELMACAGVPVDGCDLRPSETVNRLRAAGIPVEVGHDPSHVEGAGTVVVTAALPTDHPELARARDLDIPVLKRAEALGVVANRGTLVAIAGTHGKTTTTALAAAVLASAGMEPTGVVGGKVPEWEGNLLRGRHDLFVVEADEYDRSFLQLQPDVAVVTNVEADHLDIYGDASGVRDGFVAFLECLRPGGRVILCADDHGAARLVPSAGDRAYTYGLSSGSQLRAVDVEADEIRTRFRVMENGEDRGRFVLATTGAHNLRNALAAAAVGRELKASWEDIGRALASFGGVSRRFEHVGDIAGVVVIDDYAHHPTEVRATIDAVRSNYPGRRLVASFQPHLFSRTRDFAKGFGDALAGADVCWLTDIYPAREKPIPGVTGDLLVDATRNAGAPDVRYEPTLESLSHALIEDLRAGDVLVTMGAGSIESLAASVVGRLQGARDA